MKRPRGRGNGYGLLRTRFGTPPPPRSPSRGPARFWPRRPASCSWRRRRTGSSSSRPVKWGTTRFGGSISTATTRTDCSRCWRTAIWSRERHSPRGCANATTCFRISSRTSRPRSLHRDRGGPVAHAARVRSGNAATSVVPADVRTNHFFPVGPVVGPPVPDAQRVADAFAPQDARHFPVVLACRIMLSNREDNVLMTECREASGITLMTHEIERIARVHIGIGVAARQALDVVRPREANDPLHQIGIAKSEAQRMVRTEARADGDKKRCRVPGETERDDFIPQVAIVLEMAPSALTRMDVFRRVPAFLVHVMQAIELDPPTLQVLTQNAGTVHPAVGPFGKAAQRGGEYKHPRSAVTQHLQLHLASQGGAAPPVTLLIHRGPLPPLPPLRSRNGSALRNRLPQADS